MPDICYSNYILQELLFEIEIKACKHFGYSKTFDLKHIFQSKDKEKRREIDSIKKRPQSAFNPSQLLGKWYESHRADPEVKRLKEDFDRLYGECNIALSTSDGADSHAAHERWYRAEMLLEATRTATHKLINKTIPVMWKSVCDELEIIFGSIVSAASFLPKKRAVFDSNATDEMKVWYSEIEKHHSDQKEKDHMKKSNSDMSKWADQKEGPIQMAKLFCTTLGESERACAVIVVENLDADAAFNIIKKIIEFGKDLNEIAASALNARHICKHAPNPELSDDQVKSCMLVLVSSVIFTCMYVWTLLVRPCQGLFAEAP